jgi:hypothetical protein
VSEAPRKSGINIPEAQRNTVALKLRVSAEIRDGFAGLASAAGRSLSDQLTAMVERETKKKPRQPKLTGRG